MPVTEETVVETQNPIEPDPEDYEAWSAWRENGGGTERTDESEGTPAVGEKEPTSEPLEETQEGQIAEESGTEEEAEQEEEEEVDPDEPAVTKSGKGLERRMRELTGEIKRLKSQIAEATQPDAEEEVEAEVVSAPEPVAEAEAIAPKLNDYEDTDTESQWDQYEKALHAFNKAELVKGIAKARAEERALAKQESDAKELKAATDKANAEWGKASERYADYDAVVVNDVVQISQAMLSVCRADMTPEDGTDLAYYLGKHPEEAKRIAGLTMANNDAEWQRARVRAGIELAKISAKIAAPVKPAAPKAAPKTAAPAPIPSTTKKVTAAPKPPTQLGRTAVPARSDVLSNPGDDDTDEWMKLRNAEVAKQQAQR